jgi:hypothetical protein
MKNETIQIIEAVLISIAAIGMTSMYQHFADNIKNAKRKIFWKVRNAERLISAATIIFCVLGHINSSTAVITLSLIICFAVIYDSYYVKPYIDTPYMNSEGGELEDVRFFFVLPMLVNLRKTLFTQLAGMTIQLLEEDGTTWKILVTCDQDIEFPWQLHWGSESFRLLKGSFKIKFDWITDTETDYIVHELQGHCFHLKAGTQVVSTITLSEAI